MVASSKAITEARELASDICGPPGPALVLDAAIASIGFQLNKVPFVLLCFNSGDVRGISEASTNHPMVASSKAITEARELASDICGPPGPALVLDAAIASIGFQLNQASSALLPNLVLLLGSRTRRVK